MDAMKRRDRKREKLETETDIKTEEEIWRSEEKGSRGKSSKREIEGGLDE